MPKPATITDRTIAFLKGDRSARRTHGKATLSIKGDRFVMDGPSGSHSLAIDATDAARLDAHWQNFATHHLNVVEPVHAARTSWNGQTARQRIGGTFGS